MMDEQFLPVYREFTSYLLFQATDIGFVRDYEIQQAAKLNIKR